MPQRIQTGNADGVGATPLNIDTAHKPMSRVLQAFAAVYLTTRAVYDIDATFELPATTPGTPRGRLDRHGPVSPV